jgi:LysR family hydrogen peroxide-inducible transcriptional activator
MQLKKLEDEMGFKIFNRSTKPLSLTETGKVVVEKARRILREANELKAFVQGEQESLVGEMRIGVIPTIAPYLLPRFLPEFVENYPDLELHIAELQTDQIIRQLKDGRIDIGLLVTSLGENEIREIPIYNEPFLLYHPIGHKVYGQERIGKKDLSTSELMVLNEGHCFRDQTLEICNTDDFSNNIGFEYQSGSLEGLMQMVKQGVGYTLVPELVLLDRNETDYITRFKDPQPVREVSLVVHESFTREAVLTALRAAIRQAVPGEWHSTENYYTVKWR